MPTPTRRDVLLGSGAAAGAVAAASMPAAAATTEHYDAQPEHVSLEYDVATLERYRPLLVLRDVDRAKLQGLYGMVARSPEFDTSVCVYATSWSHQDGVSPLAPPLSDSHRGDHEWLYVRVREDTNTVEEVVFSAYHWIAGRAFSGSIPLSGSNPKAHVVSPWHQYYLTETEGALLSVEDLTAVYPSWLNNGLDTHVEPGAVTNPWTMTGVDGRAHWWRDNVGGVSADALYASALYRVGWFGSEEVTPEL